MMRRFIILAMLPLSGCVSFGAKAPPALLQLSAATPAPVGDVRNSASAPTLTIIGPRVSQELAVARVPVHTGDTSLAYVKDAQWVEPPAGLFTRLLADTITAQTPYLVISPRQALAAPGVTLSGDLINFGVDAPSGMAVVTYDAQLIRDGAKSVENRRFEARVPVSPISATTVGPAISQAANQVAAEVAQWVSAH